MTLFPLMFAIHIEEDERNLAERLKRREPAAMAELYDRYGALVQTQADGEFGWAPVITENSGRTPEPRFDGSGASSSRRRGRLSSAL